VTGSECRPIRALEGGETERASPIVPKNQLHTLGAEPAGAVVQEDRPRTRVSSGRYRSPLGGPTRTHGETSWSAARRTRE
jgi:hypothetical protein